MCRINTALALSLLKFPKCSHILFDNIWQKNEYDMCKWQIMNLRPNCAILADLEIYLDKIFRP